MSKQKAELMSVRILPNTTSNPPGKLADAEVVFEADAGPFTGLKLIGFAIWERRTGGRNVTFPARQYLRQWRTSELRVAASRERGHQRARGDSGRHPRGVQPQRGDSPDRTSRHTEPAGLRPSGPCSTAAHHPAPTGPGGAAPTLNSLNYARTALNED